MHNCTHKRQQALDFFGFSKSAKRKLGIAKCNLILDETWRFVWCIGFHDIKSKTHHLGAEQAFTCEEPSLVFFFKHTNQANVHHPEKLALYSLLDLFASMASISRIALIDCKLQARDSLYGPSSALSTRRLQSHLGTFVLIFASNT